MHKDVNLYTSLTNFRNWISFIQSRHCISKGYLVWFASVHLDQCMGNLFRHWKLQVYWWVLKSSWGGLAWQCLIWEANVKVYKNVIWNVHWKTILIVSGELFWGSVYIRRTNVFVSRPSPTVTRFSSLRDLSIIMNW